MDKVYFVGDTHGEWNQIFDVVDRYELYNIRLIHVGDIGIGFGSVGEEIHIEQFESLNGSFKSRGIEFLGIRGNHDNPKYFDGSVSLNHFRLLSDYHTEEINGEKFLFIGGAISIDRSFRTEGICYWKEEAIKHPLQELQPADVIVAHDAPIYAGLPITGLYNEPGNPVRDDSEKGRAILGKVVEKVQPKRFVHGHYHISLFNKIDGTLFRGLDIAEFSEYRV